MAGHKAVEWWRAWHGMVTDPKWQLVAKTASVTSVTSVTPGHVCAIWTALCERASQSRPRGAIAGFDAEVLAVAFDWPVDLVESVVAALREKRLIDGDQLAAWHERQPVTSDPTAKARKQRQRERSREKPPSEPLEKRPPEAGGGHAMSRNVTRDTVTSRRVTTEREKERSYFALSRSSQDSSISTPLHILDARASAGEIWQQLEQAGLPVGIVARARSGRVIARWIELGVTRSQLQAAIARAQQARSDQGDPSPINVGYIAKCLESVVSGNGRSHGFERGDAAVDHYVTQRG